ncbi:MAG: hypothetical protein AB8B49_03885 [Nitratireductor sp.]
MKNLPKFPLVLGLAFSALTLSFNAGIAQSSIAYEGGKKAFDQKISDAAANQAAKKIGELRGTFKNIDENAFINLELFEQNTPT